MEDKASKTRHSFLDTFWPFLAKTAAVLFFAGLFIKVVLPDYSQIRASFDAELARFKTESTTL